MEFTQDQFNNATQITSEEYCLLGNPQFVGQTRVNPKTKEYKMYWLNNEQLFVTTNCL